MTETETLLIAKITEIQYTIKGLMIQIEGWRTHTSSVSDFLLREVEELQRIVTELKDKLIQAHQSV